MATKNLLSKLPIADPDWLLWLWYMELTGFRSFLLRQAMK
jgi:hypothetical protein